MNSFLVLIRHGEAEPSSPVTIHFSDGSNTPLCEWPKNPKDHWQMDFVGPCNCPVCIMVAKKQEAHAH